MLGAGVSFKAAAAGLEPPKAAAFAMNEFDTLGTGRADAAGLGADCTTVTRFGRMTAEDTFDGGADTAGAAATTLLIAEEATADDGAVDVLTEADTGTVASTRSGTVGAIVITEEAVLGGSDAVIGLDVTSARTGAAALPDLDESVATGASSENTVGVSDPAGITTVTGPGTSSTTQQSYTQIHTTHSRKYSA